MGILQRAYETYCVAEEYDVGRYEGGKQPLAPVSHVTTMPAIEITLDKDGNFVQAAAWEKEAGKIIIPVTEESAGRTGGAVAHPLCDQVGYLSGLDTEKYDRYVSQLTRWNNSRRNNPKLAPILHYVEGKTLLDNLVDAKLIELNDEGAIKDKKNEKLLICWRVAGLEDGAPEECWKDTELFKAWSGFYEEEMDAPVELCAITGRPGKVARIHPKGVVSLHGNAKIISASHVYERNFVDEAGIFPISHSGTQKANAALKWLVDNQSTIIGKRAFVTWCPWGTALPNPFDVCVFGEEDPHYELEDYWGALAAVVQAKVEGLIPGAVAVSAALDAATSGRLSVTYYTELPAEEYVRRLGEWDETCCWWNGMFGIQAPSIRSIVNCAYGTQREQNKRYFMVADDAVSKAQTQRMLFCKLDSQRMPEDIVRRLVERASSSYAYDVNLWRYIVYVACSAIQKYHADKQEGMCMKWSLDYNDRSFQYGRLLAVMEYAEVVSYKNGNEGVRPTAIRMLADFRRSPWTVYTRLSTILAKQRLHYIKPGQRERYSRLTNEIVTKLTAYGDEIDKPLGELYLIGYELQRNEFFAHSRKKNATQDAGAENNTMTKEEE